MKIISYINDLKTIRKILEHLGLWEEMPSGDPPPLTQDSQEVIYEPFDDCRPGFDDIAIDLN